MPEPQASLKTSHTLVVDAGEDGLRRAAATLRDGKLVAFPTETVYGLGADATNDRAVARIFEAKGRPSFNPLIVHVFSFEQVERIAAVDDRTRRVAERFWPGALTLVLPRRTESPVSLLVSAGLETVAVRMPSHPVARKLLRLVDRPVAAPSANRSGRVSPTAPLHVLEELDGRIELLVAAGRTEIGLESTVVDLTGEPARLLRPGSVTIEELRLALPSIADKPPDAVAPARPNAPGQLESHYAPAAKVRLEARDLRPGEALLTFGPDLRAGELVRNLSETGDLTEAAANLFAMLRQLDRPGVAAIAVSPVPEIGIGIAINDRLRRAAAPRNGSEDAA